MRKAWTGELREEHIPRSGPGMRKDREMQQGVVLELDCEVLCLASNFKSPNLNLLTKAS